MKLQLNRDEEVIRVLFDVPDVPNEENSPVIPPGTRCTYCDELACTRNSINAPVCGPDCDP